MTNKSMSINLKNTFFTLSLLMPACGTISTLHAIPGQQMPGMQAGMPDPSQMTPEQLAEWEKQLDQEIQAFVKTLPPEQQAQFHKDVEELTKVMENMNEDELMEFVGNVLSEGQIQQPPAPAPKPVAPAPVAQPKKETLAAPKKPAANAKELEARALLESIIHHIGKLMQKINSDPALAQNIQDWGKGKEIDGWQANTTWATFKADLEKFEQICKKLIDQDKATMQYRYLPFLIDDAHTSIYNALNRMNTLLSREIPDIIVPEFGLQKISPESKRALKKSVGAFAESFYTLKVATALEELIKKYDPAAQELKKTADADRQKAIDESRKPKPTTPTRVGGAGKTRQRPSVRSAGGSSDRGSSGPSSYNAGYNAPSSASRPSSGGASPATKAGATGKESSEAKEPSPAGQPQATQSKGSGKPSDTQKDSSKESDKKITSRLLKDRTDSAAKSLDKVIEVIEDKAANAFPKGSTNSTALINALDKAYDSIASFNTEYKKANAADQQIALSKVKAAFKDAEQKLNDISKALATTPEGTSHAAIGNLFRAVRDIGGNIQQRTGAAEVEPVPAPLPMPAPIAPQTEPSEDTLSDTSSEVSSASTTKLRRPTSSLQRPTITTPREPSTPSKSTATESSMRKAAEIYAEGIPSEYEERPWNSLEDVD